MSTATFQNVNALLGSMKKLDGTNWADWKFDLGMILRRAGTFKVVMEGARKPTDPTELAKWEAAAEDGLSAIGLTVDPNQKPYIRSAKDGVEAYAALREIYEKNTTSKRISLKRQFYSYHHNTSLPITDYINDITSFAAQLRDIEIDVKDTEIVDVLIYSLHHEWGNIATSLMTRSDADKLTVSMVSSTLIEAEARKADSSDDGASGDTLLLSRDQKKFNPHATCHTCKTRGHTAASCWKNKKCYNCGKTGHIASKCSSEGEQAQYLNDYAF